MINIKKREDCCGCSACKSACPKECITLVEDDEGFLYPEINQEVCIECNKCIKVCPVLNSTHDSASDGSDCTKEYYTKLKTDENKEPIKVYAAFNLDKSVRETSTSGGVFSALANYVIRHNGVVYGAILSEQLQVIHVGAQKEEELSKFRGSKYVQSNPGNTYKQIKYHLDKGIQVLYSGTPCQIEGLKSFLGKNYQNLLTVDIFCHGVGSPKYWNKYIHFMEDKYKSKIKKIRFREKTYGYNSACMAVYFKNGKVSRKDHDSDLYWTAFSKCFIFRPSCYSCKFKTIHHTSDFTIGDYWGASELGDEYKKANGCTLLLVHTKLGENVLKNMKRDLCLQELDLYDALVVNGGHMPSKLISSSSKPKNRDSFFSDMDKMSVSQLIHQYIPLSIPKKIKIIIKPFLYKTGLLEKIKRGISHG